MHAETKKAEKDQQPQGQVYTPFPGADEKYHRPVDWRIYDKEKYHDPNWSPDKE
jgi:hypothetical protein